MGLKIFEEAQIKLLAMVNKQETDEVDAVEEANAIINELERKTKK